jgi:hypothetical protein
MGTGDGGEQGRQRWRATGDHTGTCLPSRPAAGRGENFGAWGSAPRKVRAVTESEGKNTSSIPLENLALTGPMKRLMRL